MVRLERALFLKTSYIPFDRYDWKRDSRLLLDVFSENVKQNLNFKLKINILLYEIMNMLEGHQLSCIKV